MAEQSCRPYPALHQMALDKAIAYGNSWMIDLIKAVNPDKMSPADYDMLNDYLEEQ